MELARLLEQRIAHRQRRSAAQGIEPDAEDQHAASATGRAELLPAEARAVGVELRA